MTRTLTAAQPRRVLSDAALKSMPASAPMSRQERARWLELNLAELERHLTGMTAADLAAWQVEFQRRAEVAS